MLDLLLSLPMLAGCLISMVLSTAVGLSVYLVAFRFLSTGQSEDQVKAQKEVVGNLFRVVGWLLSLLLGLTFADVFRELVVIKNGIHREAAAIMDTADNLRRIDHDAARNASKLLVDYVNSVIEDDWPALADDRLGDKPGRLLSDLKTEILRIPAKDSEQEMIKSRIAADMDLVSDSRLSRLQQAQAKPPFLLAIVFIGYLITMICFGVYRPSRNILLLISLYTLFLGIVVYLILFMSDPFHGAIAVSPEPLQYALDQIK